MGKRAKARSRKKKTRTKQIQSETQERQQTTFAWNGSVATVDEIEDSPCHQLDNDSDSDSEDGQTSGHWISWLPERATWGLGDGDSQDGQTLGHSIPWLPQGILYHIHSLMPLDAAARAACVSHGFLSSWRCYPKLIFSSQTVKAHGRSFRRRIDRILRNHSGIGLKVLGLYLSDQYHCIPYFDRWLHDVVTPGIEELILSIDKEYTVPCSILSREVRNSIQSLHLYSCAFRPPAELGALRSLTSLHLDSVCITEDELGCLLSNSLALERLDLTACNEIVSLKVPSVMQKLRYMRVACCNALQVIENNAPRLSSFHLYSCAFRPPAELGALRSLTSLHLDSVCITEDELGCLLSNSLALERLDLTACNEIVSLKVPSVMQKLRYMRVACCNALQVIENNAPSLSSFHLFPGVQNLSLGEASQMMKELSLYRANAISYAHAELPSIMPNLESLSISLGHEENTLMLPFKFVNLKHLYIQITSSALSPSYDYSSLISFLDASPSLETWRLEIPREDMRHELVGPSSHLRQLPERQHHHLKIVDMIAFNTTKSLVELTCCIVKSAISLERLTLDTLGGECCSDDSGIRYSNFVLEQASRAVEAIRMYIEDKVAPTTKLTVLEPCARCHANAFDD